MNSFPTDFFHSNPSQSQDLLQHSQFSGSQTHLPLSNMTTSTESSFSSTSSKFQSILGQTRQKEILQSISGASHDLQEKIELKISKEIQRVCESIHDFKEYLRILMLDQNRHPILIQSQNLTVAEKREIGIQCTLENESTPPPPPLPSLPLSLPITSPQLDSRKSPPSITTQLKKTNSNKQQQSSSSSSSLKEQSTIPLTVPSSSMLLSNSSTPSASPIHTLSLPFSPPPLPRISPPLTHTLSLLSVHSPFSLSPLSPSSPLTPLSPSSHASFSPSSLTHNIKNKVKPPNQIQPSNSSSSTRKPIIQKGKENDKKNVKQINNQQQIIKEKGQIEVQKKKNNLEEKGEMREGRKSEVKEEMETEKEKEKENEEGEIEEKGGGLGPYWSEIKPRRRGRREGTGEMEIDRIKEQKRDNKYKSKERSKRQRGKSPPTNNYHPNNSTYNPPPSSPRPSLSTSPSLPLSPPYPSPRQKTTSLSPTFPSSSSSKFSFPSSSSSVSHYIPPYSTPSFPSLTSSLPLSSSSSSIAKTMLSSSSSSSTSTTSVNSHLLPLNSLFTNSLPLPPSPPPPSPPPTILFVEKSHNNRNTMDEKNGEEDEDDDAISLEEYLQNRARNKGN